MKALLALLVLLSALSVQAKDLTLVSLSRGTLDPLLYILKFSDGTVGFFKGSDKSLVNPKAFEGHRVEVTRDEKNTVTALRSLGPANALPDSEANLSDVPYQPSVLANYKTAEEVLGDMNRHWIEGSQCYDRAHVWAYEENKKHGTNLMKVFLFFSDAYIERYTFPWWFHAAPFAYVRMSGQTNERILDPRFAEYPLKFKLWTDLFMKNKSECKDITKYSDFSTTPGTSDCYLLRTSMFTWQPKDLESFEATGAEKTNFVEADVDWAFKNGFGQDTHI